MPISLCGNMLFQSVGKGGIGTFLASIRSGVVFIPILIVLSHIFGIFGIQISQTIADFIASAITLPFIINFFKKTEREQSN
jgi:Na+-driven multidrug efflux pump